MIISKASPPTESTVETTTSPPSSPSHPSKPSMGLTLGTSNESTTKTHSTSTTSGSAATSSSSGSNSGTTVQSSVPQHGEQGGSVAAAPRHVDVEDKGGNSTDDKGADDYLSWWSSLIGKYFNVGAGSRGEN